MKKSLLFQLISIRLKATVRNFGKNFGGKMLKKNSKGMTVLFGFLMLYLLVISEVMFVKLWDSFSVFCTVGFTWLYFSMCGILSLAMTVILSVFTTQNQLYNAKDNDLLLSMPIPPGTILLSRMSVLLATSLGTVVLVTAPAVGVYLYRIGGLNGAQTVGIFASVIAVTLTAQALSCILGYFLHLILRRVKNKAAGSMVFAILFLAVYFSLYSKVGEIINYLLTNSDNVASVIKVWAAPVYSLGLACSGEIFHSLLLLAGSALIFGAVYVVLSRTFVKAVNGAAENAVGKKKIAKGNSYRRLSPVEAVFRKELRRLLTCPIYLTNTGLGVIMIVFAAAALPFMKSRIEPLAEAFPWITEYYVLLIPAFLCALNGMSCFTAPSVSLEGKNLWVMRSMPVSGRDVLLGKLKLHLVLTGTASAAAGLTASVVMGLGVLETVLVTVFSWEAAAVFGLLGLVFNLLMPNFNWLNEAVPCKQGLPVLFIMLSSMAVPVLAGLICYLIGSALSPVLFLAIAAVVFLVCGILLLRLVTDWGGKRFESFVC